VQKCLVWHDLSLMLTFSVQQAKRQKSFSGKQQRNIAQRSGVNFINGFCTAFTRADPKSVKWYWQLNWNFTLSGSVRIKASSRTLMKLTPASRPSSPTTPATAACRASPSVNFTYILLKAFAWADLKSAKNTVKSSVFFVPLGSVRVKATCKMLVKLTPRSWSNQPFCCLPRLWLYKTKINWIKCVSYHKRGSLKNILFLEWSHSKF